MAEETADLKRMLSEPKAAILSMSLPLMVAFFVAAVQTYIDSFWCAGLGPDASSAISVSGPVYWIIMDIGSGLGVGASTAIARSLGAKDKARADSLASQILVFTLILSFVVMGLVWLIADPVLSFMNGGQDTSLSMDYVMPMVVCSYALLMNGIITGLLRSEGAAKTSMYMSFAAAIINIVLDPILIYTFDLGVMGAAIATCLSFVCTVGAGLHLYLRGRMYVTPCFKGFRFVREQLWDIFVVGIPHMLELVAIPIMMMPQNYFVTRIGGSDGIMTYSLPFRYVTLAVVPAQAIAASMVPVTSAAIGQKDFAKARYGFAYTARTCILLSTALSFAILFLADVLAYAFTYSDDMAPFHDEIAKVIRIYAFVTVCVACVDVFSGILQTLRFAQLATVTIFLRECLFITFYWISTYISMDAIYWSLLIAEAIGAVMMGFFARYAIGRYGKEHVQRV